MNYSLICNKDRILFVDLKQEVIRQKKRMVGIRPNTTNDMKREEEEEIGEYMESTGNTIIPSLTKKYLINFHHKDLRIMQLKLLQELY